MIRVTQLDAAEISLVAEIDRSEHVDVQYGVEGGQLVERPVALTEVPRWSTQGIGEFSVAGQIAFCTQVLETGGLLLGAFDDDAVAGLSIVDPAFEPALAWLAYLHVSRPSRRRGVAASLWAAAAELARAADARSMYVSATPTGSAVGFYLAQGCLLADPVIPELFAHEPEDIHLTCPIT